MLLRNPSSLTEPSVDREVEKVVRGGGDVLAEPLDLVWPVAQDAGKYLLGDRHEIGMSNPSAVEPVAGFAKFVITHFGQRNLVYLARLYGLV